MPVKGKSGVHSAREVSSKPSGGSDSVRRASRDLSDTFGVRGAGASWQASFGMALNERDLLFAVRREPVAWRLVFQVAHMAFLQCWNSEIFGHFKSYYVCFRYNHWAEGELVAEG